MNATTRTRSVSPHHAGPCFLASCLVALIYFISTRQTIFIVLSLAFTLVNLAAIYWIRNNGTADSPIGAKNKKARLLCLAILALILFAVPQTASAQNPSPTPSGSPPVLQPQPTPPWEAGNPSAQISQLMNHVRELVPYIRRQIERPLLKKFQTLAVILGSLVLLFSFIRVIRENDGASQDLYYWFGRAAIFMAFFAIAPMVISTLYKIGRTLTIPIDNSIEEKRQAFNDTYYKLIHGTTIIRDDKEIDNRPLYWKNGEDGWIAILTDRESGDGKLQGLKNLEEVSDMTSWKMPKLFFALNVSRGILQAGEVFLLLLGGFIMIGLRLAAPFMCAVAIDKRLAEKITYPFLWGTVVFTLIFPVVRDVLTYIAYTIGSFGLMMYKGEAIYSIDAQTAELVKTSAYDPTLVIIITVVLMTITGLMLWLSPYLAYRIATGQVFEAVSSTASGWMAAIIGSAVEFAGLKAGASLQRQAENTQTQAGWQAEMTRARGSLDVSNLGAQARKVSGLAAIQGNLQSTLGAIHGNATGMRMQSMVMRDFTIASVRGQVGDSNRQVFARKDQAVNQADIGRQVDNIRVEGESAARRWELVGQGTNAIPLAGNITAAQSGWYGNEVRQWNRVWANDQQFHATATNETATASRVVDSQQKYRGDIEVAAQAQYEGSVRAANTTEAISAGGAMRGAGTASGGVNKAYGLEMQANQVQFDTTTAAAGTIREAGFKAAKMRELSTVITGVARDMDRRIEEGMRQRY